MWGVLSGYFCLLNRVGVAPASRFAIPRQGREAGDATALFLPLDFFAEQRANGQPWASAQGGPPSALRFQERIVEIEELFHHFLGFA